MTEQEIQEGTALEVFAQIAEIDEALAQNKSKETQLKEQREVLEKQALEIMTVSGMNRININGRTIYINTTAIARPLADKSDVADALVEAGYGQIVKTDYNSRSLNSLAKEWIEQEGHVPEALKAFIDIMFIDRIRSKKG